MPAASGVTVIIDYDGVIIGDIPSELRNDLIKACYSSRIRTYTLPKLTDVILKSGEVLHIFDSPVLLNRNHGLTIEQRIVKRSMDIVLSLIATVIASPFMLVTAIAIKLEDGGPVFFKQKRATIHGKEFDVYKLRTMKVNVENYSAKKDDDRITKPGAILRRTRIDELPQLLNVLKGDMTFVGPRPEMIKNVQNYTAELPEFRYRLRVKAGLTGYAQISGKKFCGLI